MFVQSRLEHRVRRLRAVVGVALVAVTACGGGDDGAAGDGGIDLVETTLDPATGGDGATTSPSDGSGCPVLSDEDAAAALGVESLTFEGFGTICTWQGPDGEPALSVSEEEPFSEPLGSEPAQRAESWEINGCLGDARGANVTGAVAIVCDSGTNGQGRVFAEAEDVDYLISIGDPYANPDDAQMTEMVDQAAAVTAELKLPNQ